MKHLIIAIMIGIIASSTTFAQKKTQKFSLKTQKDKISYIIGTNLAKDLKNQSIEINMEAVTQGMKDIFAEKKLLLTEEEIQKIMTEFQQEMMEKYNAKMKKEGEKNKKEEETFLAENAKKDGIKTLPSGLQYQIITDGTGATPTANDTVVTNYAGTLLDGTEFDNSYKRGEPVTFPVKGVIAGWTEALQLMKVGSKWKLYIPSKLAYGERGAGQIIGPNSALIFEVELLDVKPEKK